MGAAGSVITKSDAEKAGRLYDFIEADENHKGQITLAKDAYVVENLV